MGLKPGLKPGQTNAGSFKKGEHRSPATEFKKGDPKISGENSNSWKGGAYNLLGRNEWQRQYRKKNREVLLKKRMEYRHKTGENKKYQYKSLGLKSPPSRFYSKVSNYRRRKKVGKLDVRVLQLVYEDNIKRYGTLTCYLCLKPILFGKDTLDHKLPLSREGTHKYNNLAIACGSCNCRKHSKTEQEYREYLKQRGGI